MMMTDINGRLADSEVRVLVAHHDRPISGDQQTTQETAWNR